MSDSRSIRGVTPDSSDEVVDNVEGVQARHLQPFTTLLVQTRNSLYRVVITPGPEIYVQGGVHFPSPTPAYLDGSRVGGRLKVGWIGVGLLMQFRSGDRYVITSPVRAITTEQASSSVVH